MENRFEPVRNEYSYYRSLIQQPSAGYPNIVQFTPNPSSTT